MLFATKMHCQAADTFPFETQSTLFGFACILVISCYQPVLQNHVWLMLDFLLDFLTFFLLPVSYGQVKIPFSSLRAIFRARTKPDAPEFDPSQITALQVDLLTVFPVHFLDV